MNILGIETSCDETAAAVVADGHKLLSNVIASQIDLHAEFGGVVPEVAARSHIEKMLPVVDKAIKLAGLDWKDIDGIAVTAGPGLLGSLLIGVLTAKMLSEVKKKPLYSINHVEAHVYANFIGTENPPQFPLLALVVSGGHSQFVLFQDHHDYKVLGQTLDDAAGEAFDKIAKLLDLGFPGGPAIAKAALDGNENAYKLPKAKLGNDSLDYSFSGLKTAVLRQAQELAGADHTLPSSQVAAKLSVDQKNNIAASFQKTVVDTLVDRMLYAFEKYQPKSVVIAGGVAANQKLREELSKRLPIQIDYAPMELCTDNAAMVAALGYHYARENKQITPEQLVADSSLSM
ncbi:MAG TPA: tRNA (adenosine(37)-N6)-threonylcarbamoyltransferase complex transferase subunit TsaD [Candidatus Nanoarchaeia archaeon]|nr:tRNA (adenosine(37)-N6)-threonylcarbamoyltransferase complex transferase subunit TsaD [Candidatus Nanoarchaeia archaeon]